MKKPPFILIPEFISPLQCEVIVDGLDLSLPQFDEEDNPQPLITISELLELRMTDATLKVCDTIDEYYGVNVKAVSKHRFIWYPEGYKSNKIISDNSVYKDGEWCKRNSFDFSALLFLTDYSDTENFDSDYEVYGGRIQFPNFRFSLKPERGSLIVYPSSSNFMYNISQIYVGDLVVMQVFFECENPYEYRLEDFENDYRKWKF